MLTPEQLAKFKESNLRRKEKGGDRGPGGWDRKHRDEDRRKTGETNAPADPAQR